MKRYIEDGDYPGRGNIRMKGICKVPEHPRSFDRSHAL